MLSAILGAIRARWRISPPAAGKIPAARPRRSNSFTAAFPSSPISREKSFTYRSICACSTFSSISWACRRIYSMHVSGLARAHCRLARRARSISPHNVVPGRVLLAAIQPRGIGRPVCLLPPLSQILQAFESMVPVGESAFMDDDAAIDPFAARPPRRFRQSA